MECEVSMELGTWFWVLYVLTLLFGIFLNYDATNKTFAFRGFGGYFVLWILVGMLGYRVFGSVVKG